MLIESPNKVEDAEIVGLSKSMLPELLDKAHSVLGLHMFYTSGEQESKGYSINLNDTAYNAAGKIHTDFQKGFICAEVISYEDFIKYKGWTGNKVNGSIAKVGKTSIMKSGSVVLFRFNL